MKKPNRTESLPATTDPMELPVVTLEEEKDGVTHLNTTHSEAARLGEALGTSTVLLFERFAEKLANMGLGKSGGAKGRPSGPGYSKAEREGRSMADRGLESARTGPNCRTTIWCPPNVWGRSRGWPSRMPMMGSERLASGLPLPVGVVHQTPTQA